MPTMPEARTGVEEAPPTPFIDPWLLKMAGYCPFIAVFSKNFYYNSIIVTTLDSLPFPLANVKRNNIRKVVIVFDEYLEALQRTKPRIRHVNIKRAWRVSQYSKRA